MLLITTTQDKYMKSVIKSQTGNAFIEFSLVLPFLLIMFLGTIDLLTYVGANYKMAAIAENIGESATALDPITNNTFNATSFATALNGQISQLTKGNLFPAYTNGYVIVSDIYNDISSGTANPSVKWKFCVGSNAVGGSGTYKNPDGSTSDHFISQASIVTSTPAPITSDSNNMSLTLKNGNTISIDGGEQTIVVEVFGQFTPQYPFYSKLGSTSIYKASYAEPIDSTPPVYPNFVFPSTYTSNCP